MARAGRAHPAAGLAAALLACALVAGAARADEPETVRFETKDGFRIAGSLWPAADPEAPVALLLHQFNRDRRSFPKLVPALREKGFTVLAIDQRGQGESLERKTDAGTERVRIHDVPRDRVGTMVLAGTGDVAAALAFLRERGLATQPLVLVGASYGCTVALLATREQDVAAVVLLSPGSAYFGVEVLQAARDYRGALFAIAAEDDPVRESPGDTRDLAKAHEGPEELLVYETGGHGTGLLDAHPELAQRIAELATKAAPTAAP